VCIGGVQCMGALKMMDQIAGHEIAEHKIARHENYFFIFVFTNPSNF